MLNYIATEDTARIIKKVCRNKNILILYENIGLTDIHRYLKETKANFKLIGQFIIELDALINSEKEIIESISNLKRIYGNTRIILLAQGINAQSEILTELYRKGINNIINSDDELEIRRLLKEALSDKGINKEKTKKFKKIEEVTNKDNFLGKVLRKIRR